MGSPVGVQQDVVAQQLVHVVGWLHLSNRRNTHRLWQKKRHFFFLARVHFLLQWGEPTENALHHQVFNLEREKMKRKIWGRVKEDLRKSWRILDASPRSTSGRCWCTPGALLRFASNDEDHLTCVFLLVLNLLCDRFLEQKYTSYVHLCPWGWRGSSLSVNFSDCLLMS